VTGRSVPSSRRITSLTVHTQISLCNYTLPPLPSANTLSLIFYKRRITSISQQHFHNQRVCCEHQFTDRCNERESPTHPRSSPLRLGPQASPTVLRAGPCTQQPHSAHLIRSTAPSHIMSPLLDLLPGAAKSPFRSLRSPDALFTLLLLSSYWQLSYCRRRVGWGRQDVVSRCGLGYYGKRV
jgi:hypothetical protein